MNTFYKFRKNNISGKNDLIRLDSDFNPKEFNEPISLYYQQKKNNYISILDYLFVICILYALSESFLLKITSENLFSKSLLELISKIAFAYITGYIFFNIVTRKTETERKKNIYAVICGNVDSLVNNANRIEKSIWSGNFKENESEFLNICNNIDLNQKVEPSNLEIKEMIIIYGLDNTNKIINRIYTFMPFLEGALVHIIGQIENSFFIRKIQIIKNSKVNTLHNNESESILQYLKLIDELGKINNILKDKYLKNYSV